MKPRPSANEDASAKPFWTIVLTSSMRPQSPSTITTSSMRMGSVSAI
jgi:hypothetical protein